MDAPTTQEYQIFQQSLELDGFEDIVKESNKLNVPETVNTMFEEFEQTFDEIDDNTLPEPECLQKSTNQVQQPIQPNLIQAPKQYHFQPKQLQVQPQKYFSQPQQQYYIQPTQVSVQFEPLLQMPQQYLFQPTQGFQHFIPAIMNLPSGKQQQQFSPKKIPKQKNRNKKHKYSRSCCCNC